MKVFYNAGAIAKIFSKLAEGRVSEEEFLDAETPDQVDALMQKARIHPDVAQRVQNVYSRVEGSIDDGFIEAIRDDSVGPAPKL